jgi:hypothetical protein
MKIITKQTKNFCEPNSFYEAWYETHKLW